MVEIEVKRVISKLDNKEYIDIKRRKKKSYTSLRLTIEEAKIIKERLNVIVD